MTMTGGTAPLGVAILGGGFMAGVHAHAARAAGAHVVGVVSSNPHSSAAAAARLATEPFDSGARLVEDPHVDVVHVCTPNALHADQVTVALSAGKAVVCEKPLALTATEARRLVALAGSRVATVPFVYRYHPLVREIRARLTSGAAGDVSTISGRYLQDWLADEADHNWRVDAAVGGPSRAFADIGSHLVDLIEFVTGDRLERLAGSTRTVLSEREVHGRVTTEDAATVTFTTARGAIGSLLVSQVAPGRKNQLAVEIAAAHESLGFDQERPETLWVGGRRATRLIHRGDAGVCAEAHRLSRLPAGHPQGYQDAFNAFVADTYAAVSGDRPEGLPTFADGARALEITEAVMRAARSGEWTTIAAPEVTHT